jgi:hypothetical protein
MGSTSITQEVSHLKKDELLQRAKQFIFSTGINDGASKLCKANMKYGLAQFHLIQEKYGFEPKALFISSPDETISRNAFRWNSGLGYGGRLNWGKGNERFIFLNVKPNHCGILVGGLGDLPNAYEIIKQIDEIKATNLYHDNIQINWDYGISNHFINCFKTKNLSNLDFPPYMFMVHGSAPEFRDDKYGIGLYIDKSKTLKTLATEEKTIFGNQYILLDDRAEEYLEFNKRALEFSNMKRKIIANNLFGNEYEIICNQPHQFLKDYNNMYLGSNCTDLNSDVIRNDIFPTTLRADIAAYLFKGKQNFSETTLRNMNFIERAEKLELLEVLRTANILPHGGGYTFPDIKKVRKVMEYKDQRYFECELRSDTERVKIVRDVTNLQFEYRGRSIALKTIQLDLGDMVARLNPIFSLKV